MPIGYATAPVITEVVDGLTRIVLDTSKIGANVGYSIVIHNGPNENDMIGATEALAYVEGVAFNPQAPAVMHGLMERDNAPGAKYRAPLGLIIKLQAEHQRLGGSGVFDYHELAKGPIRLASEQ